ncbi:MAG: type II secretion system protein [Dethiobacter sp.]|jgi:prepilin-type N-terminal cleavage/methylation domain-containing protein|nr:type II secretion system protein [Dethiobacter sp.]
MNRRGVTLIEMLVVIMIVGILAGVAVPVARQSSLWPLRAAANELAVRIRATRHMAIVEGSTCHIIFHEFNNRYKLEYPGGSSWVSLPEGINYAANNFPLSLDGRPTLYFRYTGAPNRGGHVALKDRKGNKLYVIVTPVTGRVRIDTAPP